MHLAPLPSLIAESSIKQPQSFMSTKKHPFDIFPSPWAGAKIWLEDELKTNFPHAFLWEHVSDRCKM